MKTKLLYFTSSAAASDLRTSADRRSGSRSKGEHRGRLW